MSRFVLLLGVTLGVLFSASLNAQVLDDEDFEPSVNSSVNDTQKEDHEVLFDDMFGEHIDELPNNEPPSNTFEAVANEVAKEVSVSNFKKNTSPAKDNVATSPLEGELFVGVSQGSFRTYKDMIGRTKCTFGVTLKSTLNKNIKMLALRLVYNHGSFAFIFRDVKPGNDSEKFITTTGDICYNLVGVPDIDINRCRIVGAREDDCMKRLKWDDKMVSPNK